MAVVEDALWAVTQTISGAPWIPSGSKIIAAWLVVSITGRAARPAEVRVVATLVSGLSSTSPPTKFVLVLSSLAIGLV